MISENELGNMSFKNERLEIDCEQLEKENTKLKKQLENIPTRERIIEVIKDWKIKVEATESKLSQYFDCEDNWTQEDLIKLMVSEILGEEREGET